MLIWMIHGRGGRGRAGVLGVELSTSFTTPGGSMNTSTNLNQSASIVKDEAKVTRQRAHLERRRMRIMRQRIPSPPPPSPHRPLPLHLLVRLLRF
ncbi:hypothetical protein CsSME_00043078 [Camellia sinensis var. sinensis]